MGIGARVSGMKVRSAASIGQAGPLKANNMFSCVVHATWGFIESALLCVAWHSQKVRCNMHGS
jgi:hypothetical protein